MSDEEEFEVPAVRRESQRDARSLRRKRRTAMFAGGVLASLIALGVIASLVVSSGSNPPPSTTTTTTSSTTTTTTPPVLATTVMPLTGIGVDGGDPAIAAKLNRPALAVKIDNDPAAMPQQGLEKADLVVELRVEGISRYIAVFHSQDVAEVGPVRSARTSDPDILAMLVHPIFAWSGGNKAVSKLVRATDWIQNLSHDVAQDAYSRTTSKKAPHNLMLNVEKLYERVGEDSVAPQALFSYLSEGREPAGVPVSGFEVHVGSSHSSFIWNEADDRWERWANGRRHVDGDGTQLSATNVVVLATEYGRSPADKRSPEANTIGSGSAWSFTGGQMVEGSWHRDSREKPWRLLAADGTEIALSPGNTWVQLPGTDQSPRVLPPAEASSLIASAE